MRRIEKEEKVRKLPVNASKTLGFAVVNPAALRACAAEILSRERYNSDSAIFGVAVVGGVYAGAGADVGAGLVVRLAVVVMELCVYPGILSYRIGSAVVFLEEPRVPMYTPVGGVAG